MHNYGSGFMSVYNNILPFWGSLTLSGKTNLEKIGEFVPYLLPMH